MMVRMTEIGVTPAIARRPAVAAARRLNPFLHVGPDRLYDPLTDRTLLASEPGYGVVRDLIAGSLLVDDLDAADSSLLAAQGWLLPADEDPARRFLLKYVSLEAHTVCNQTCYFCPVSVAPRESYFMPTELYERIVGELSAYRDTIEAVFMISYNEPTLDKRFVDQARTIKSAGLPPAVLTNGTGLTPARIDALVEMGGLRFLSINLSTLDRERYKGDRGGDHLGLVLRHVEYAATRAVAEQMDMVVLGTGDDNHERDFEEIRRRFEGSRFTIKYFEVNDRAGYLGIGLGRSQPPKRLRGCDLVGSRPLQHLHINPRGQCILCCQDYTESQVVGDLTTTRVADVLTGPGLATMRRWTYGLEEAPASFICRSCKFALTD
jgi:radical SAM family protein/iron-sulfur cluster protein